MTDTTGSRAAMNRACAVAAVLASATAVCCAPGGPGVEGRASPIIYGDDGRLDFYEVSSAEVRERVERSLVALVPSSAIKVRGAEVELDAPTWGDADRLCPGERFADQPAAAFCSGVLADWDLVLTAGHCARLLAVKDFVAVLGYHYLAPGKLAARAEDVIGISGIAAERLDPEGAEPQLDFAWFRLGRLAPPARQPAPLRLDATALALGQAIVSIGTSGGVPMKIDEGGTISDARGATGDYFLADTDTSHGSSGGGAFDSELSLVGVLARGGDDLALTEAGCYQSVRSPDTASGDEQYTYVKPALDALCATTPRDASICRVDCGDPCRAAARPLDAGCSVAAQAPSSVSALLELALLLLATTTRRGTARA